MKAAPCRAGSPDPHSLPHTCGCHQGPPRLYQGPCSRSARILIEPGAAGPRLRAERAQGPWDSRGGPWWQPP
ncbi:hypothetical protein, partial [Aeromonas caviae]|uniref:hypothetical protein n=1 Tax=Aeromonas caviae TaxID=648 RepID=UPI001FB95F9F